MDHKGNIVDFNPAAEATFGHARESIVGRPVAELMPAESRGAHRAGLARYMATGEHRILGRRIEVTAIRADGSEFPAELTVAPVEGKEPPLFTASLRDITERVRAEEERRRLLAELVRVQEDERRRIATEIHDDPVQAMTAVEMRLESLRRRIGSGEERRTVEQLGASVSAAIGRLRRLLVELRPARLDREGLGSALQALLDRLRADTGSDANLEDRTLVEVPPDTGTVLYRIAQEAVTNIRKHAHAREVRVTLAERDGGILLRVRDDGQGFDPQRQAVETPGHLGLVSMRERAELAGGKFRITSTLGTGTTVEAWVPGEDGDG
jgi:PAS domain S-box-containing protein